MLSFEIRQICVGRLIMLRRVLGRLFPSVSASSTPKGSIILIDNKYFEILANESKHVARQAGFIKIEAAEVLTGKKEHLQLSANGKVHKVEMTKENTSVQYIEKQTLFLAEEAYNTVEVPLSHVPADIIPYLEPGTSVGLMRDSENGNLVKCQFPSAILMKAKNKQKINP